jgi:hypothetical protein
MARFAALFERVRLAVLTPGAATPDSLRAAIVARMAVGVAPEIPAPGLALPEEVAELVDAVGARASDVDAEDLVRLERAGWTQEQIFEITVAAAVGAGVARYTRVQRLLEEGAR